MKLNNDCIRDILLSVESMDYNEEWTIDNLILLLTDYSEDELQYHCIKLHEAGFLKAITVRSLRSPLQIARIQDLTFEGHQFLANIRSDKNWNTTKKIAKSIGANSISAITQIASNIVTSLIQNQFDPH